MIVNNLFYSARKLGLPRRRMLWVFLLSLAATACEAAAVLLMVPALEFVQAKGALTTQLMETSRWKLIAGLFSGLALPVSLGGLLLIAFVAILARQAAQYAQRVYTSRAKNGLNKSIRQNLFRSVLNCDLAVVEGELKGKLLNDFTLETETAASAIFYSLQFLVLTAMCTLYFASLLALSTTMTLLSIGVIAGTIPTVRYLFRHTQAIGLATMQANQRVGAFMSERLAHLRLIKLSGMQNYEIERADRLLGEQAELRIRADKIGAKLPLFTEPAAIAFAFFSLWFGSIYLELGIETVAVFLAILLRLVPIAKDLMGARQVTIHTQPALDWIMKRLTDLSAAAEVNRGAAPFLSPRQSISFASVNFSYARDETKRPTLRSLTLNIPAGKTIAIVGPSGGGKSTLIDLLPRLRNAQSGQISVDGLPLDTFQLTSLRDQIAFVPQTAQIFNVTAAEYICYGRPNATLTEIEDAARLANAHSFISALPKGFDTPLGEGGNRLSGGQRQRLDLARAIARKAPILILDEPTSALDAESEQAFRGALDTIAAKRDTTIIIIAHRLSTISHANQIVVVEDGRISDTGAHEELMARGGWYARSWTMQSHSPDADAATDQATPKDRPNAA